MSLNVLSRSPSVTLECGGSICADIVVGADGVEGITRSHFVASTDDSTGVLDKEKGLRKGGNEQNVRRSAEAEEEEEEFNIFRYALVKWILSMSRSLYIAYPYPSTLFSTIRS